MRTRALAEIEKLLLSNLLFVTLAKRYGVLKSVGVVCQLAVKRRKLIKIGVPGILYPIFLRPKTSDIDVFVHVLLQEDYKLDASQKPEVIVDGGANIGLTSIYFANKYPQARIYAIEPEPSNFELLEFNVSQYTNITPVRKALWRENTRLHIVDPGFGKWGTRVARRGGNGSDVADGEFVEGITLRELMRTYQIQYVDVLKLDIEGAEQEVFSTSSEWIDAVGVITAELHDRMRMGCSRAFYEATRGFTYEKRKGDNVTLMRTAAQA